ncbi:hypothetical protein K440DRAFT_662334 [Wilcoxina mikolae CBS 423.85]|nr:hypothetical protein K440DRAFT_662334 [Wilcoxina mikolae CBS 423.85]
MTPTIYNIDPSGDVTLNLASDDQSQSILATAKVSSKCLSLGSPVFAAMLRPNASFLEGSQLEQTGSTKVTLVGDNIETMIIVVRALHYRSRQLPTSLTIDELFNLALVVNKYDCFQPLFPWIRLWVTPHRTTATFFGTYHKWLYISWVFEESVLFTSITKKLISETKLDDDGEMVTIQGEKLDECLPDGIIDALKKKRHDLVERLVEGILKEINKYQECISSNSNVCSISGLDESQRTNCDTLNLGALTRCLLRANLWPTEIRTKTKSSLDTLGQVRKIEKLGAALTWSLPKRYSGGYATSYIQPSSGNHSNCGSYSTVIELANSAEKSIQGLWLSDFLRKR